MKEVNVQSKLEINILSIKNSDFNFSVYSKHYLQYEKNPSVYFTKTDDGIFGVSYTEYEDFEKQSYSSFTNTELTKWYLLNRLTDNCRENNIPFSVSNKFTHHIDVEVNKDYYGKEIIRIIPTYLNAKKIFGFILNYKFRKNDNIPFSKEVQKRSLSLDEIGSENKNYYIDNI